MDAFGFFAGIGVLALLSCAGFALVRFGSRIGLDMS